MTCLKKMKPKKKIKEEIEKKSTVMKEEIEKKSTVMKEEIEKKSTGMTEKVYLAGGCFWCMEAPFEGLDGVTEVYSGYSGGLPENANYKSISTGKTKHRETVEVVYDPEKISYEKILEKFWMQIDPTDTGGQFADRGFHYTTAIFYKNESQREEAEKQLKNLEKSKKFEKKIETKILPYNNFFRAEEYHQDYYKKAPEYYQNYKKGSGREGFIEENWAKEAAIFESSKDDQKKVWKNNYKKMTEEELKNKLTELQFEVTQKGGTERPFDNKYWDNKESGIYVDIVSGEPLFLSSDKYTSGTGWPSFTSPAPGVSIIEKKDTKFFMERTEALSKIAGSHLGHIFNDGPKEKGGLRYCMNSASLEFIKKENMDSRGYGEFLKYL